VNTKISDGVTVRHVVKATWLNKIYYTE